jgi:GAF domain-containing protein
MFEDRNQDTGGKLAQESAAGCNDLERMLPESPTPERVCLRLAQILRVRSNEVALLRLEKSALRFVFPSELCGAGMIPLSGASVAARTVAARTPLLSNSFARVRHLRLFESIKLNGKSSEGSEQMPIQKIISVPVVQPDGRVLGVVQVSRKGPDKSLAGADFTREDVKELAQAAQILARMPFMQDAQPSMAGAPGSVERG